MQPSHIFVLGTGRSGTCWMGGILGKHKGVTSYVEPERLFDRSVRVALSPNSLDEHFPLICKGIDNLAEQTNKIVAYKVHPMLWFSEKLAEQYPEAKFIGMQRSPHACVSSMLQHYGVRKWCEQWKKFPTPNPFLGITKQNLQRYAQSSILERSVFRWLSHFHRMNQAKNRLQKKLLVIQYEKLVNETHDELVRVQKFLEFRLPFPGIQTNPASLHKWKDSLKVREIAIINGILEEHRLKRFAK